MIDSNDKQTLPLIPEKRGRGRPKTGTAMTAAQKQKAYRDRNKHNVTVNTVENLSETIELRQQLFNALERIEQLELENKELGDALARVVKKAQKGNVTESEKAYTLQARTGSGKWLNLVSGLHGTEAERQLDRVIDNKLLGQAKNRQYRLLEDREVCA